MFTGIVEHKVKIKSSKKKNNSLELSLSLPKGVSTKLGDSICVSGCCLTVAKKNKNDVSFHLMKETLDKTIFGKIVPEYVNIERALKMGDRLGGHMVTGHVDAVGEVIKVEDKKDQKDITIKFPSMFVDFLVKKGSVCVDGVSLTISKCTKNTFTVSLIPHTLKTTTLDLLNKNDFVNLEFDIMSKHIVNLIKKQNEK